MDAEQDCPLVVDLDGTLINTDLLVETAFEVMGRQPWTALSMVAWLAGGRARLKQELAARARLEVAHLPYNEAVLESVRAARNQGRRVILASASDERLVAAVADHLGLFDAWMGSDGTVNLAGGTKAARLQQMLDGGTFDYIGNSRRDLPVWRTGRRAILANAPDGIARQLGTMNIPFDVLPSQNAGLGGWLRLLRPHQWAKNVLVFLALFTAHRFTLEALEQAVLAFIAFSLCASAVYVLNDLVDIQADRQHPAKRKRPFASGHVQILHGLALAPVLLAMALVAGYFVSPQFLTVLACYFAITAAYTFVLKRLMVIDVVTLAVLYTVRIIGGAVAIAVPISQWLLAFSIFLFLCLALVKRFSEIALRADAGLDDTPNRDYRANDLPIVGGLAAASGYNAVIVFALYLSSDAVKALYAHPTVLWASVPLLIYWISRVLLLMQRRQMPDDPVVFALRDRVSWLIAALTMMLGWAAH